MFGHRPWIISQCVIILCVAGVSESQAEPTMRSTLPPFRELGPADLSRFTRPVIFLTPQGVVLEVNNLMPSIGQSISFKCAIQPPEAEASVPIVFVTWYKDGEPLSGWPNKTATHTLTVTLADSGSYRCQFESGPFLSDSAEVHVTVISADVLPFIIGGAVASLAAIGIIVAVIIFVCVRKRRKENRSTKNLPGFPEFPELPNWSAMPAKDVHELPDVTNHVYEDILEKDVSSEQRPQGIRPPAPRYKPAEVPRVAGEIPEMTPEDNFYEEAITPDLTKPRHAAVFPAITATAQKGPKETPPEDTDYVDVIGSGPAAPEPAEYQQLDSEAMFNQWMVDNKIDDDTKVKLRQHCVHTIQDINNLSYPDLIEIGLKVGQRNRIKKAKEAVSQNIKI